MRIYRFDPEVGKEDDQFGSLKAIIARVVQMDDEAKINAIYLQPNKSMSHQQAMTQQLFLIVKGNGWVRSESDKILAITEGQAMLWEKDEWHESGTENGMTAVIIETVNIQPVELMPLLQEDEL
jgi:mannose-6-phosphate isomerase-like protein (cupin superfamily)